MARRKEAAPDYSYLSKFFDNKYKVKKGLKSIVRTDIDKLNRLAAHDDHLYWLGFSGHGRLVAVDRKNVYISAPLTCDGETFAYAEKEPVSIYSIGKVENRRWDEWQ